MKFGKKYKLYVLVEGRLALPHQAVQAGHAVAEWVEEHIKSLHLWDNTLVYLSVPNLKLRWAIYSKEILLVVDNPVPIRIASWGEPMYGQHATAIALLSDGTGLEDLRLLGVKERTKHVGRNQQ